MKLTLSTLVFVCATLTLATTAHAGDGEINYGSIKEVRGDTLFIQYKSPSGASYFTCDIDSGDCDDEGDTAPQLFAPLVGIGNYPKNDQGTMGIRQYVIGGFAYYVLYDLSGKEPKQLGRLPVTQPMDSIEFTPSGESILFIKGSQVQRYDVMTQHLAKPIVLSQSSLPFKSISHNGTYISAYNYGEEGHKIWNTNTGVVYTVPSTAPSYVEYSQDETRIAFADRYNDYKLLYTATIANLPTFKKTRLMDGATVEDYVFADDTLFFMANIGEPLIWNIYAYEDDALSLVEEDVSYGDFMKTIGNKLTYIKVDGKNANVHVHTPRTKETIAITPIPDSPVTDDITRAPVKIAGRHGALLTPDRFDTKRGDLYIWLHGGPQRQTSVNYHSYLSYAVYDELLEKIAEAGNYVLKLDYSGSTGYGDTFRKALQNQIGIVDVQDVREVVKAFTKENKVDDVFLIGNSYGGYLSLKALADDADLYDGAISINGVTDWYGLISRIPSSPFNKLFGGPPTVQNYNGYLAASAYTGLVDNVKDEKILVIYGDSDSSVPTWQSTQYVDFAEANNKNVTLLKLEGEDHVLKKRSSLTAMCERIERKFRIRRLDCE